MTALRRALPFTAIPPSPKRPHLLWLLAALLTLMILTFSSTSNAQEKTASSPTEITSPWEEYKRACDGYRAAAHERRGERDEARRGEDRARDRASACEIEAAIEDDRHERELEDARKQTRRARIIAGISAGVAFVAGLIIGNR